MTASHKQALLFDFGGTLDSNGLHWPERFYRIYKEDVPGLDREIFERAFYDADDNLHKRYDLSGLDLEETVLLQCADTVKNLGISNSIGENAARRFSRESRAYFTEIQPILKRLAGRAPLGIVSNFYGNLRSILDREGWLDLFGAVADSTAVGAAKPDRKIFAAAYESLGVTPEHCWMIGDSVARDMKGAAALGMRLGFVRGTRGPQALGGLDALCLDSLADLEIALEEAAV